MFVIPCFPQAQFRDYFLRGWGNCSLEDQILLLRFCCPHQLLHRADSGFFGGGSQRSRGSSSAIPACVSQSQLLCPRTPQAPGHPQGHHLHSGERGEGDTMAGVPLPTLSAVPGAGGSHLRRCSAAPGSRSAAAAAEAPAAAPGAGSSG